VEGHEALVLVDLSGGKLPGDDAAEDAVHKHYFILRKKKLIWAQTFYFTY
jgi:hypothetical protein